MLGIDKDIKVLKYETVLMQMNSILNDFCTESIFHVFYSPMKT